MLIVAPFATQTLLAVAKSRIQSTAKRTESINFDQTKHNVSSHEDRGFIVQWETSPGYLAGDILYACMNGMGAVASLAMPDDDEVTRIEITDQEW